MKNFFSMILILSLVVGIAFAQDAIDLKKEKAAIKETALNYIEGWYTGNPERMEKALHDDLAKRGVLPDRETGKIGLVPLTKVKLVEYTKAGYGKRPKDEWNIQVTILDVLPNSATVKIYSVSFIDYIHMAKLDGEWKIVNVLWEPHPKKIE